MATSYEAIKAVLEGKRISRAGWNGKGMYVYRYHFRSDYLNPCLILRAADGFGQPGWVFSQADIFADDWEISK